MNTGLRPTQLAWLNTGDVFGSREIVFILKLHSGGNAKVRTSAGVREVGIVNLTPADDPVLQGVEAKYGLLWRNGEVLDLPEADLVARAAGEMYAERLVQIMGGEWRPK